MIAARPERILVPTDFSEAAEHAMRYASDLALRIGASLTVVYSDSFVQPIDYAYGGVGSWNAKAFEGMKAAAEERMQAHAESCIDTAVLYDTVVRVAPPVDGILAQALESGCGIIVMGTHGRTGFRRLLIGSVTESVMRKAEVPVISVPPSSISMAGMRTIVCPAVYREESRGALAFAAQLAPPDARFIVTLATPSEDLVEAAADLLTLRSWLPAAVEPRSDLKLFPANHGPAEVDQYAVRTGADLIVAAESSQRSPSSTLYGTFAARLVQHSHCPVLTVNPPTVSHLHKTHDESMELAGIY